MKKWISCLLAVLLALSVLTGCGSGSGNGSQETEPSQGLAQGTATEESKSPAASDALAALPETLMDGEVKATPEMYSNIDLSEPYTVYLYLIGDTPQDWDRIMTEVNAYLEPFNTTLDTTIISWADVGTKYSLVLAGGEDIDAIFTAPWEYMYTEAAKGSFYTFDRSFIENYMPLTAKYQPEDSFSETTVEGKIVAIPCNMETPQNKIVGIRQDLAEKHGITSLENWDDYMNFMLTIAEKETPESGILAEAASGNNMELWDVYRQQYDSFYLLNDNNLNYIYSYKEGEIPTQDDIQLCWNTDYFNAFAKDMKTLADAGCWSRGALSGTVSDDDAFAALQGASIAWNASVYDYMKTASEAEGVKCMAYDLTKDHLVACEEYNNNDLAIAAASKNPERTAMVLDILKMDTYVNRLVSYGIEGEHYTLDGFYYTQGEKVEAFPPTGNALSWAVRTGLYEEAGMDPDKQAMVDSWEPRVVSNPTVTFVFNDAAVADYAASCKTVLGDYVPSLQLGLVDDVDAYLADMNAKLAQAGIDKVEEELFRQYNEWAATR